jgi:hypothetical protein
MALLIAGQTVEGARHTTDAITSAVASQGEMDELWISGRSAALDRWR